MQYVYIAGSVMKIGYVRVSTEEQATDRQLDGLTLDRIYEEKVSGAKRDRQQLQAMLDALRAGDEVFVHEMSRLGRSLIDLKTLVGEITGKGVTLHFLSEGMTFSPAGTSPTDELLFNLLASFAEFERKLLRQRQAEGIAKAKQAGVYAGSAGRKPKLDVVKVRMAKNLLAIGNKKKDVAATLGVSRPTLDKALADAADI